MPSCRAPKYDCRDHHLCRPPGMGAKLWAPSPRPSAPSPVSWAGAVSRVLTVPTQLRTLGPLPEDHLGGMQLWAGRGWALGLHRTPCAGREHGPYFKSQRTSWLKCIFVHTLGGLGGSKMEPFPRWKAARGPRAVSRPHSSSSEGPSISLEAGAELWGSWCCSAQAEVPFIADETRAALCSPGRGVPSARSPGRTLRAAPLRAELL